MPVLIASRGSARVVSIRTLHTKGLGLRSRFREARPVYRPALQVIRLRLKEQFQSWAKLGDSLATFGFRLPRHLVTLTPPVDVPGRSLVLGTSISTKGHGARAKINNSNSHNLLVTWHFSGSAKHHCFRKRKKLARVPVTP